MVWNAADIHEGMEVIGLDGSPIGQVGHVWLELRPSEAPDLSALAHSAARGLMPLERVSGAVEVQDGWFLVPSSEGDLYVPFGGVQILFPGQNVTLACTASECAAQYRRRPENIPSDEAIAATT